MEEWLKKLFKHVKTPPSLPAFWQNEHTTIFIYGTGTMAQDVYRVLTDHGWPVTGFIDHMERENPFIHSIRIYQPQNAPQTKSQNNVVILGIHNYQADLLTIIKKLNNCGFNRIVSIVELYDHFGAQLGVRYWLTSRNFYPPLAQVLEQLDSLWADERSQSLYRSILEFRLTGDATLLPAPDFGTQYHPEDVPSPKLPIRFVDCGAFDGDTLSDLIKVGLPVEAVAAFEPDLANFGKLKNFISQESRLANVSLWPCGVYSSTTQLTFETGKDTASGISASGKTIIQCIALDDAIPTFAPTLIKMDIEGSEYEALLGARRLIEEHTPGLALSVYHRPEHLWQLPLLAQRLSNGNYHFYLRSHAYNGFELFLYAIPH
ncbi:MAG: FkbM family methyltransferase [Anaerolineales bacterium]